MDQQLRVLNYEFRQAAALKGLSARIQISVRSLEKLAAANSELREVLTDLSRCHTTLARLSRAGAADLTSVREYRDLLGQLSEEAERLVLNVPYRVADTLANQKDETE